MKAIINEQIIIITEIYTFIHTKLQSNYCNENELDIHDFNTGTVQTIATFTVYSPLLADVPISSFIQLLRSIQYDWFY